MMWNFFETKKIIFIAIIHHENKGNVAVQAKAPPNTATLSSLPH